MGSFPSAPDRASVRRVVAIDGPAGAGKTTVAREVAAALGLSVLDTGAMYRALTWAVLLEGADPGDPEAVAGVARRARIEPGPPVLVEGREASEALRSARVSAAVSAVASHPAARRCLVDRQRAWIEERRGGVVEGRDIGTVVAPEAALKVFLVADEEERARRRLAQEGGEPEALTATREAIRRRDTLDASRAADPLCPAPDAVVVDTTGRTVADVVAEIVRRYRQLVLEEAP